MKATERRLRAFTMIEILLSASLIVVLGLVLVSSLSGGLSVWQRLSAQDSSEDTYIFFEKLSVDLYNSFQYHGIAFSGRGEGMKLAGIVTTSSGEPGLRQGVGEISYAYDPSMHAIVKTERNLTALYRDQKGVPQTVLSAVSACEFRYYMHDELQDKYVWLDEWKQDAGLPLGVKVTITVTIDGKPYTYSKTIPIPSQS